MFFVFHHNGRFVDNSPSVKTLGYFLFQSSLFPLFEKLNLYEKSSLTFAIKKFVVLRSKIGSWTALISISCMFKIDFTFNRCANLLASVFSCENAKAFCLSTKFSRIEVVWINCTFLASPSYCRTRSEDILFQTWKQAATFATESASIGAAFYLWMIFASTRLLFFCLA